MRTPPSYVQDRILSDKLPVKTSGLLTIKFFFTELLTFRPSLSLLKDLVSCSVNCAGTLKLSNDDVGEVCSRVSVLQGFKRSRDPRHARQDKNWVCDIFVVPLSGIRAVVAARLFMQQKYM